MQKALIEENDFIFISEKIKNQDSVDSILQALDSFCYTMVNGKKVVKLANKYLHEPYLKTLNLAFNLNDKKVYDYLISLLPLIFQDNNEFDTHRFLEYLNPNDEKFIAAFLSLRKNTKLVLPDYSLSIMILKKQYNILFYLLQNKSRLRSALISSFSSPKHLSRFMDFDVRDSFNEIEIDSVNATYTNLSNAICLALLKNDIVSLNILMMTGKIKLPKSIFKDLYFLNNEAMQYLRMVYHLGLEAMQEKFQFKLECDYDIKTNDKLIKAVSNLDEQLKNQYNTLSKKPAMNKPLFKESGEVNNLNEKITLINKIKSLLSKKESINKKQAKNRKSHSKEVSTQVLINNTFSELSEKMKQDNHDSKDLFKTLENTLINIVLMSEFKNNTQIQNDMQLILHKTLPSLIHSYIELVSHNNQSALYFQELKKTISIMEQTFSEHFLTLRKAHEEKLLLNFSENVAFVEKKFLTQKNN